MNPWARTTLLTVCASALFASQQARAEPQGPPGMSVDVRGYYLQGNFGGDPAFSRLSFQTGANLDPNSYAINMGNPDLEGGGVRAEVKAPFGGSWFSAFAYTGFFIDESASIGGTNADNDNVFANLVDRTLADDASLNGDFDEGKVDFASDRISIDQHIADLTVGQQSSRGGSLAAFWKLGLRFATTDLERDVLYRNLEGANDLDTARIGLRSDMWGVGPTVGAGVSVEILNGLKLSGEASASALYSKFDLSRRDAYTNASQNDTEIRQIEIDSHHVIPVVDASIGLSQRFGRFELGVGYTVSAWLGGARSISVRGWDDVDDETSPYRVTRDDIITHGIYANGRLAFGPEADQGPTSGGLLAGASNISADIAGLYVIGKYGGDTAFGGKRPITGAGIDTDSFSLREENPQLDGGGVRASITAAMSQGWFTGLQYSGIFIDEGQAIGQTVIDGDLVQANLLDFNLADDVNLNGDFDEGEVDFASNTISIDQHVADLTIGQRNGARSAISAFWQAGIRFAKNDVDRAVTYQNVEGGNDVDTARINFGSEMRGVGPTFGGGLGVQIFDGLFLTGQATASALYGDFNLKRTDTYVNQSANTTQIRRVSIDQQAVVPVVDAQVELTKRIGRFEVGVGYAASAWLGGARAISINGLDDVDDDTSAYTVTRDDIITHSLYGRAKLAFGAGPLDSDSDASAALFNDASRFRATIAGLYVMGQYGGDTAFNRIAPITGAGIDTDSINNLDQSNPELEGGGVKAEVAGEFARNWIASLQYTGFFVDENAALGQTSTDRDNVRAALIDGSLADDANLNDDFDAGPIDFASDNISINQHIVDLTAGRQGRAFGSINGFWRAGLRVSKNDVDRDVVYRNLEGGNDLDTARIAFRSEMWGVGPTVGGGFDVEVLSGLTLSGEASASALYANFDLSRRDAYVNQSANDTEIREISIDQQNFVPMFDASIGLTKQFGALTVGLGYSVSATLGGARAVSVTGNDDINSDTTPYTVTRDDIIVHGVYARAGVAFPAE